MAEKITLRADNYPQWYLDVVKQPVPLEHLLLPLRHHQPVWVVLVSAQHQILRAKQGSKAGE